MYSAAASRPGEGVALPCRVSEARNATSALRSSARRWDAIRWAQEWEKAMVVRRRARQIRREITILMIRRVLLVEQALSPPRLAGGRIYDASGVGQEACTTLCARPAVGHRWRTSRPDGRWRAPR